jgi:hypothetical protein
MSDYNPTAKVIDTASYVQYVGTNLEIVNKLCFSKSVCGFIECCPGDKGGKPDAGKGGENRKITHFIKIHIQYIPAKSIR